jgi:hypothetical protein
LRRIWKRTAFASFACAMALSVQAPAMAAGALNTSSTPQFVSPVFRNGTVTFSLTAKVPGATKWKVRLSSPNGQTKADFEESRNVRTVKTPLVNNLSPIDKAMGKKATNLEIFEVGPFAVATLLLRNTVNYEFYACTNDNKCTRPARGSFYACAKPARGEGCSAP